MNREKLVAEIKKQLHKDLKRKIEKQKKLLLKNKALFVKVFNGDSILAVDSIYGEIRIIPYLHLGSNIKWKYQFPCPNYLKGEEEM